MKSFPTPDDRAEGLPPLCYLSCFVFFALCLSTDINAATPRRARRIPPTFASICTHKLSRPRERERKRVYTCCNTPPKGLADSMTMRDEEDGKHFRFVLFCRGVGLSTCLFGGRFGSVVAVPVLCQYYIATKNAFRRRQEWNIRLSDMG